MPAVSIILPTYNRAKFLPEAFAAIQGQAWTDWELIVVDDGSTDNTRELIPELTRGWSQRVAYIYQENQGAYGARNTGLDHATGKYIAFYDSDDLWLPHHLSDCMAAFASNPDVDWIFAACRLVNRFTNEVICDSHFHSNGGHAKFLGLTTERRGNLNVIRDPRTLQYAILYHLEAGLQHSVIACDVFKGTRFHSQLRNEAEDQLFVIRAVSIGRRFAYLENVHVQYVVHGDNSSGAAIGSSIDKRIAVFKALVEGFELLPTQIGLTSDALVAWKRRLAKEYFWHYGYSILWTSGRHHDALQSYRRGLQHWPWSAAYWKTYLAAWLRIQLAIVPRS